MTTATTTQYDYSADGSREIVGEWHMHPLQFNKERLAAKMDQAYKDCFTALADKTGDLEFWVGHCNLIAQSYEKALRAYETHRHLEHLWNMNPANMGKVS